MERHVEERNKRRSGGKFLLKPMPRQIQIELRNRCVRLLAGFAALLVLGGIGKAQDNVRGSAEPIVRSLDPSRSTYHRLVAGNLAQNHPGNRKFKTLQAAHALAPAGTEETPTVIGIKPNVCQPPNPGPRTPQSASKCMFQLHRIENSLGAPIDDRQALSGVFKPNTKMALKITGNKFSVEASGTVDNETSHLEGTVAPNLFGDSGVRWTGGSANVCSRMDVSYPGQNPSTGDTPRS